MSFSLFTRIDPGEKYSSCFVVGVVLGWIPDMRGRISEDLVVIVVGIVRRKQMFAFFFLTFYFGLGCTIMSSIGEKAACILGIPKMGVPDTRAIHVLSVFRSSINACSFLLDGNNRLLDFISRNLVVCQAGFCDKVARQC